MLNSEVLNRIEKIAQLFNEWTNENSVLYTKAIPKTVDDGFFPEEDILFAVNHLRESVTEESLKKWAVDAGLTDELFNSRPPKLLCLLAGNLPLVGFQDILVGLMSGVDLNVKVSRKDPYLITSFLDFINQSTLFGKINHATILDDFVDLNADVVFFSGSDKSVPDVKKVLHEQNIIHAETKFLIRTTHFSVCFWNDSTDPNDVEALIESIWRYDGKGCRSTAIIFCDKNPINVLKQIKEKVLHEQKRFPSRPTNPALWHRYALNEATETPSFLWNNKLLEVGKPEPWLENVVFISSVEKFEVDEFLELHKHEIQSKYANDNRQLTEPISKAQKPNISWKPDGVDPLHWLINRFKA